MMACKLQCNYSFTGIVMRSTRLGHSFSSIPKSKSIHYIKQPRDIAIDILIDSIEKEKDPMDIISHKLESLTSPFDQQDRNTVKHLVSLTMRHEGQITKIIKQFLKKLPRGRVKPIFEGCLRLAICELAFTDNASYGIVSFVMNYFRHHPSPITLSFLSLLNGVLRKISEGREALESSTRYLEYENMYEKYHIFTLLFLKTMSLSVLIIILQPSRQHRQWSV